LPSESRTADVLILRNRGAMESARLLETPEDEIAQVFGPGMQTRIWIDPQLSAVYVISNSANSLLKIGHADNLKHRFSGMDCGSPVELSLRYFVFLVGKLVAKSVESQVHDLLSEQRCKGEWFDVSMDEAIAAIAAVVTERKLAWWTEGERRKLGTKASSVHDAKNWHGKNFFLRH